MAAQSGPQVPVLRETGKEGKEGEYVSTTPESGQGIAGAYGRSRHEVAAAVLFR